MQTRMNVNKVYGAMQALRGMGDFVDQSGLEPAIHDLILVRASQLNHCASCLDMHTKDARASGETEQRLYSLNAWRETPYFTDRERAALEWTEAVTVIGEQGVPDEVYERVNQHFTEEEMISLTMTVITINSWNRLNLGLQFNIPGRYQSKRQPDAARGAVPAAAH